MSNIFEDEDSTSSGSLEERNDQNQARTNFQASNASNNEGDTRSVHQSEDVRSYGELILPHQTVQELAVLPDTLRSPETPLLIETDEDDFTSTESSNIFGDTDTDLSDTSSYSDDYNATSDESADETESSDDHIGSNNEGRMSIRRMNVPHGPAEDDESINQNEDDASENSDVIQQVSARMAPSPDAIVLLSDDESQQGLIQSPTITSSNINDPTLYETEEQESSQDTIDLTASDSESIKNSSSFSMYQPFYFPTTGAVSPVAIDLTQDSDEEESQRMEPNLNTNHSSNSNEHLGQGHNGSDTENASNTQTIPDIPSTDAFDTNPTTALLFGRTVDTVERDARISTANSSIRVLKRFHSWDNNRQNDNKYIPGAIKRFRESLP